MRQRQSSDKQVLAWAKQGFPPGTEAFAYKDNVLAVENVLLPVIAASVGTPFYVYSATVICRNYRAFKAAFAGLDILVAYAVKANSNQAVLKLLAGAGAGADIVSGGELRRALAAGFHPQKIVYSGVGKTAEEMDFALQSRIGCFNVESPAELQLLSARAQALGAEAPVSLRINPDIAAGGHAKIATGKAENKFGIPQAEALQAYALAARLKGIKICGLDVHIGSQIEQAEPFARAFAFAAGLVQDLRRQGFSITHIDIGGGLGIAYQAGAKPPLEPGAYAALLRQYLGGLGLSFIAEPGRFITGNAGALVTKVLFVKPTAAKNFIIVDAGMNDLIRPTLYDAWHEIVPVVAPPAGEPCYQSDIVGPVCETGDYLALDRQMPLMPAGALLAVLSSGAYGAGMAGNYNSRLLVPEVLVEGGRFAIIRPRATYDSLLAQDKIPDWL
ncbi:diaminopimelate decarboxylase [Candidatus Tokpelaia sp.]|uniref:diaminopimelate decarboxylase n=1 Tax=Candidatus Tokpelaia sp. TaxID=2233777 RepID=UPI001238D132|nr:diaminopimelate decarboxylase [Candidatus Tokpelaia sp.]KAA6406046.1 diaminopimelate decarboxylase [Candidatus Tokpelaia sp.]